MSGRKKRKAPVRKPAKAGRSRAKRASEIVEKLDGSAKAFNTGLVGDGGDFPCDRCKNVIEDSGKWKPGMTTAGWYHRAGWAFTMNEGEVAVCDACIHADPRYQERYGKPPAPFTPKESRFVEEYPIDLNGAAAARRAGYSEATAKSIACELLAKPHIQDAITAEMAARSARTRIDQDRVLTGIADLAFYDIAGLFDERGAMRSIHDMPQSLRSAIAGIEVSEIRFGEVVIGQLKKVKLADRKGNLELLGRHLKLFTDKVEHSGAVSLEEILTKSREPA